MNHAKKAFSEGVVRQLAKTSPAVCVVAVRRLDRINASYRGEDSSKLPVRTSATMQEVCQGLAHFHGKDGRKVGSAPGKMRAGGNRKRNGTGNMRAKSHQHRETAKVSKLASMTKAAKRRMRRLARK